MEITTSHIVSQFSSLKQYLEVDHNMTRIRKLKTFIKKRRETQISNRIQQSAQRKQSIGDFMLNKLKDFEYHRIKLEELYQELQSNPKVGLTDEQGAHRLKTLGKNSIPQKPQAHWSLLFLKEVSDPYSLWMWLLMVLNFILFGFIPTDLNSLMLAWILIVVLISGGILAYCFNKQTANTIKSFQQFIPKYSTVLRSGQWKTIMGEKIVRGDIVKILPGEKIPADVRIIECHGMRLNNSTFTGQTLLVKMSVECNSEDNPLESNNMAFSGSVNEEGEGTAIVINIGGNTLISQLADEVLKVQEHQSPIEYEMDHYTKRVTLFAFFVGTLTFSIGMGNGFHPVIAAMIAIGVIIASSPGILNLIIRMMLTISVRNMAAIKIVAKNLYALQALGTVDTICLDKTGTITRNIMSISKIYLNQEIINASDPSIYPSSLRSQQDHPNDKFIELLKCAILSSVARFDKAPPRKYLNEIHSSKHLPQEKRQELFDDFVKEWQQNVVRNRYSQLDVIGNSTQAALIRYCQPLLDVQQLRKKYPIVRNRQGNDFSLTFTSNRKYSISLHFLQTQSSQYCVFAKGAPQIIWQMCSHVIVKGQQLLKNEQLTHRFKDMITKITGNGQRVLGFAKYHLPMNEYKDISQVTIMNNFFNNLPMVFIGAMGLSDPPRIGIDETILRLKIAGIKVLMLTGDQTSTAVNIAKQTNIIQSPKTANEIAAEENISIEKAMLKSHAVVIDGDQFLNIRMEETEDGELEKRSIEKILEMDEVVFTRTNPAQKLMIVQMLQKMGRTVAVTGDGVNDSPAIRIADCGISMGSGSDATRDAATIILIDDNLNNLVNGIEQGRKMYDNLRKSIVYVMTSQISQFVPFLFLITFRIPIPIFTLLIDSAADLIPSFAYAYEQSQLGIMTRKPKHKDQRLVTFKLVAHASGWNGFAGFFACFCCYWICMKDFGYDLNYLWIKSNIHTLIPDKSDSYNPTSPTFGNSNLRTIKSCADFYAKSQGLDWINSARPWVDLRMSVMECIEKDGVASFKQNMVFDECRVQQISMVSLRPICYTTEATKYAQTAYMFGNVINQLFVAIMTKTRRESVFTHGLRNSYIYIGYSAQYLLAIALAETWLLTSLIGTRDVLFFHMGLPAIPLGILQFTVDEVRKYLIRNLGRDQMRQASLKSEHCKPNWFQRNTYW